MYATNLMKGISNEPEDFVTNVIAKEIEIDESLQILGMKSYVEENIPKGLYIVAKVENIIALYQLRDSEMIKLGEIAFKNSPVYCDIKV